MSIGTPDKQARGYRFEEMLGEAAELDSVPYVPPYRKANVTQTDGMLSLEGFQYLIEARWRVNPSDVNDIAALSHKAQRSLQSTRGLFVSISGFRPEVVEEIERGVKNVLLMSGQEFRLVLNGDISLGEALRRKVEHCAKQGSVFLDLAQPVAA